MLMLIGSLVSPKRCPDVSVNVRTLFLNFSWFVKTLIYILVIFLPIEINIITSQV